MWRIRFCIQVFERATKGEWNATNGADARGGNPDSRLMKKSPDFVSKFLYAQRMGQVPEEAIQITGRVERKRDRTEGTKADHGVSACHRILVPQTG